MSTVPIRNKHSIGIGLTSKQIDWSNQVWYQFCFVHFQVTDVIGFTFAPHR